MKIFQEKNIILSNPETKTFLADAFYPKENGTFPLVIFAHGYKGYKDWGAWNLMAEELAKAGFFFVKFNFSHNGTSLENPSEFADLESFGQNNYSKELSDLDAVIAHFEQHPKVDSNKITLIGHSRGGGICVVKSSEEQRISNLVTLASVSTLDRFPKNEAFEHWKKEDVYYVLNGRTKQSMPHYFQFWKDFEENKVRFDVEQSAKKIHIPSLIIHGKNDEAVSKEHSQKLNDWIPNAELFLIENANHTFGAKEPWEEDFIPKDLKKATEKIVEFLQKK